ncbi:hypothetical protein ElyMa_002482400 [Elysia marginata]|uniref:Uncharacterized protein n=1 Tax=Elysia marginata TaxID=1093978 RepID=A0AAV4GQ70_9GAST|nr:hypothetical protein ElyMa_002482400 [Elysia marginata]
MWENGHKRQDGLHPMDRRGQTTLFRLPTGHDRLKAYMYKTYKLDWFDVCSMKLLNMKNIPQRLRKLQTTEGGNLYFAAAPQNYRPIFRESLKNWKRPTALFTSRGSIFEVDSEDKKKKTVKLV